MGQIIDKFQKTFDTYWQDKDFELFDPDCDTESYEWRLKANEGRIVTVQRRTLT